MTRTLATVAAPEFIGRPHDFDFLAGRWHIASRRLRQRHVGCTEWDEYEGRSQAYSLMGGLISIDDNDFSSRGFSGCTFRTLDVTAQAWSIYWVNSRVGRVEPPVVGGWNGDRGEFFGDDTDDGRPIHVRFHWERLGPARARWSQDFALIVPGSTEHPAWERNWVMELERYRD